jgi:uncharacterized protein YndB with AHSA1/START domain
MEFSNTVAIRQPRDDVFQFVADLENAPKWNHALIETRKLTEGPVGVGTEFRQVRSVPSRSEETILVTEFEPERRMVVRGDLGPFRATMTYEFEAQGPTTLVTNTAALKADGMVGFAAPIATGRIRDAVAQNLRSLKHLLEDHQRPVRALDRP